ncbi:MAG: type II secretion system protein J [Pikeienuella sp.]
MTERRRSGTAGFTLLEVMVAFVIVSLVLGGAYAAMTSATRATLRADMALAALTRAEGALARIGADIPAVPGSQRLEEDGWDILVEISTHPASEPALGLALVEVAVTLSRDGSSATRLSSLRLVAPP